MRLALFPLFLAAATAFDEAFTAWLTFQEGGNTSEAIARRYGGNETEAFFRSTVFARNAATVAAHNAAGRSWRLELNEWADLTAEEWVRATRFAPVSVYDDAGISRASISPSVLPASVDWAAAGVVTPAPSSGSCGAGVLAAAFVGAVESALALKVGKLVPLGTGQALACACDGCGPDCTLSKLYAWGETSGLTSSFNESCKYAPAVRVLQQVRVRPGSEIALMTALALQPVVVGLDAASAAFQFYVRGVITTAACGTDANAQLLAVGYGQDPATGTSFYKLCNAWGSSWGENGYVRIGRGDAFNPQGECGVQLAANYPVVQAL